MNEPNVAPEEFCVVLCTVPNEELGKSIARVLVEERLAACVNILAQIRSVYRWQGEVCEEPESLLLIKTRRELFAHLSQRLGALHPYTVPELIALPFVAGAAPYLTWLGEETR